jgi:hypothetical protein
MQNICNVLLLYCSNRNGNLNIIIFNCNQNSKILNSDKQEHKKHYFLLWVVAMQSLCLSQQSDAISSIYKAALADSAKNRRAAQTFFPAAETCVGGAAGGFAGTLPSIVSLNRVSIHLICQ